MQQASDKTATGSLPAGGAPHLLSVASEHGVYQLDAMGQAGGDHVTWPVGSQRDTQLHFTPTWICLCSETMGFSWID